MKILVCIKEVIDPDSSFDIDESNTWIRENNKSSFKLNYYDQFALEQALIILDNNPDTEIDILSAGPQRIRNTINYCLERGAHRGFLIEADYLYDKNPLLRVELLSHFIKDNNYDLIFCGLMAEDTMASQTGQHIAAKLGIPCATSVKKIKLNDQQPVIYAEREIDSSTLQPLELSMPALLTFQSSTEKLRYPTLTNKLAARKKEIQVIDAQKISTSYQQSQECSVTAIKMTHNHRSVIFIEGDLLEKAQNLKNILFKENIISG